MTRQRQVQIVLVVVSLAAITWAAFSGVLKNAFINYDDNVYVTDNAEVQKGLNAATAGWAFTTTDGSNWHPLTWLSHLLDVSAYGLDAGKHHRTSLLIHEWNVALLFLLLLRMTGALWRSAFAASLFAIHPLHVESVAWIAERKDVLSTLFWLLALLAWVRYVERRSLARYLLVALAFALGLMAKPMVVTLPFTLLLLDVWPLRRDVPLSHRLWEKAPLFAMSIASAVVTYLVQRSGGAVQDLTAMPFADRLANASVSYTAYLWKTVWPAALAPFYPYSHTLPLWQVAGSLALLAGISVAAYGLRARAPYVLMGWLWYLGTLVPVIGLVQVGGQAMADRYTYVPLIGIFVAFSWAISGYVFVAASAGALVAALFVTQRQVAAWSTSATLFTHALAVTSDNWLAHNDLGLVLFEAGKTDEAIAHYTEALWIAPNYVEAHNNLGNALEKLGKRDEAIAQFRQALSLRPGYARVHNNIGVALWGQGKTNEAIAEYGRALEIDPGYAKAEENLALALAGEGRLAEAIDHYERALRTRPDSFETLNALGLALAKTDRLTEAIGAFEKALAVRPGSAEAHNNLAGVLAAQGHTGAAIEQLKEAVRLDPGNAEARFNLENTLAAAKAAASGPAQ